MTKLKLQYQSERNNIYFDQLVYQIGSYHYNWHKELEVFWLLEGEIEVIVDSHSYNLKRDDLLIINPNSGHATFAKEQNSIALRMHIDPMFFFAYGFDLREGGFLLNSSLQKFHAAYDPIRRLLTRLLITGTEARQNRLLIDSLFYSLMQEISGFFTPANHCTIGTISEKNRDIFDSMVAFIEENYYQDISLDILASKYNYSTSYLSRLFKEAVGINFYEYLVRTRLQNAVRELANADDKIASIALRNGFTDIKSFNLMFRKHFGKTPSEYRQNLNPHLIEIDESFKKEMGSNMEAQLLYQLQRHSDPEQNRKDANPCDSCEYKIFKKKYASLLEDMSSLLEKTKND